jgi:hypothetical protein
LAGTLAKSIDQPIALLKAGLDMRNVSIGFSTSNPTIS